MEDGDIVTEQEILNYARANGMIDYDTIRKQIEMNERKKYLEKHKYSVWQGADGKWRTRLYDTVQGKMLLKKRNTEQEIEDVIVEHYKREDKEPTILQLFEMWIDEKQQFGEIQKSTVDKYYCDFYRFFTLNDFMSKRISYVDPDNLELFIKKNISDNNLTSKAYSNLRTLIYGIFKYAKKKKYTTFSITQFMGDLELSKRAFRKRVICKEKEVFTEDEVKLISEYVYLHPTIINLGILLAFQTGMRVGELCTLKNQDINKNTIHVQRTEICYKNENNKTVHMVKEFPKSDAGDRYLIITDSAQRTISMIKQLNPFGEYLFSMNVRNRGFGRIYGKSFNYELHKLCKAIGILPRSMHKIRKTYGTTLLDANVDESIVIEQMGHSDISCTKKYYYYSNKSDEKKYEQISKAIVI